MPIPLVAIVGRPNVGKSSLFNWLAGKRIAIVDPTAGVTRDRVMTLIPIGDRFFELTDTGGMGVQDVDDLTDLIESQIQTAIDQAHLVLFLVDARSGLVPLDEEVANRLRSIGKPVLLVVNKCDTPELETHASEFHRLGLGSLLCVSALQSRGKDELLAEIQKCLPPTEADDKAPKEIALKLAIVGRRNTGKSTFINQLAESERMIVSEVAGTTRDSVDVRFERDGKAFIAIDTAGVRKKGSVATNIEFYGMARAERSIRRADVVLLFLDAALKISKVDKQLCDYILEQHTPAIFVANKWDLLVGKIPTGTFGDYIRKVFPSLDFVPIAFITAKSGKNVQTVLNLAQNLHKQAGARVGTGELNQVVRQALADTPPPLRQNRRAKVYYATQAAANPPTIVLFTNGPELLDNTYRRYLLTTFRDRLPFHEVPIKLYVRAKERGEGVVDASTRIEARGKAEQVKKARKPTAKKPANKKGRREAGVWKDV